MDCSDFLDYATIYRMSVPLGQSSPDSATDMPKISAKLRTDRRVLINTGALMVSSLWRIGLSFILQLLIANQLGSEGLGQYATALAYLNICQVLSELGLPQLLVRDLASFPEQRSQLFRVALLMQITAAVLVWGLLVAVTFLLPYQPTTRYVLVGITASLPLYAISSVCMTILQSGERMELVMSTEMFVNFLIVASSIVALWQGGTIVHLALILVGTQFISVILYVWQLHHSRLLAVPVDPLGSQNNLSFGQLLLYAGKHARFFYGLSLTNVLLHRVDILLISIVAGERITGIYSAAYLVARIFIVLSQNYWQALYPTLSRLYHHAFEQYRLLASLGVRYGLMVLLPIAGLGSEFARPLLQLIFRNELSEESIGVFQVLIWVVPLYFLLVYVVNSLLVERKPLYGLRIALIHLAATSILLPFLTMKWTAPGASVAVFIGCTLSVAVGLWLLKKAGGTVDLLQIGTLLVILILALGAVHFTNYLLPAPSSWVAGIISGSLVYGILLWQRNLLSITDLHLFRKVIQP
jgi:O-antigen/teichoic acid export membrane protein